MLPSVVDTGDICCHYWQLMLIITLTLCFKFVSAASIAMNIGRYTDIINLGIFIFHMNNV